MLRIAVFTPTLESTILLSPIYIEISRSGHTILFYDVVEESGWFEKGLQYISLGYSKPRRVLRHITSDSLINEVDRIISKDEPDIAVLAGYSPITLKLLNILKRLGLKTIHVESGLRNYKEGYWEALRQAIDWSSRFNVLPSKRHYENLYSEGFPMEQMYITGSLYVDSILTNLSDAIKKSSILEELNLYRDRYIYSYISSDMAVEYSKYLGEASIKLDIDIVLPLRRRVKDVLKDAELYYRLMTDYYVIAIEQIDYLDHINLIYNSSAVITDDPRVSLESAILKKDVYILEESNDLYGLIDLGAAKPLSINEDKILDLKWMGSKRDISPIFGGGESRFHVLDAIEGFSNASYRDVEWRGLYLRKNGELIISDVKYNFEGV